MPITERGATFLISPSKGDGKIADVQPEGEEKIKLGQRIQDLLTEHGFSKRKLAQKIGIVPNTVTAAIRGQNWPTTRFWVGLHRELPDIDLHFMITGESRYDRNVQDYLRDSAIDPNKPRLRVWVKQAKDSIELAGLGNTFSLELHDEYPIEYDAFHFYIYGTSMEPVLRQGDIVHGQRVDEDSEFVDGAVYMVLNNGKLRCKRVFVDEEDDRMFRLRSDNRTFDDRLVDRASSRLWRVLHAISARGLGPE